MGWLDKFIVSERGQWDYPGLPTAVPTSDGRITMKGVPYPVIGYVPGYPPVRMEPGSNYQFPGNMVYEIPMAQEGMEMPFGLPLRSSNPSSPYAYESPVANGYLLPDPNRPELLNTGATEYKMGVDDVMIPTIVNGNYMSPDDAYARYLITGEQFMPTANPESYSRFYDTISQLGLMKQQRGGDISIPDLSNRGWLSKYQVGRQTTKSYDLMPSITTAVRDVTIQPKINISTANFDFKPVDEEGFEKIIAENRVDEEINKRQYKNPNITTSQAKSILQARLAEEEAQKKLNIKDYSNADVSEVTKLQQELYQAGYNIGKTGIDGDYGKNTDKAYKDYVSDQALELSTIDRYYNKYKDTETDQYSKIVENIQQELVQEGLLKPEQVDGKFENITKKAIQKYNKKGDDNGRLDFGKIPLSLKETRCAAGMCEILETKGIDTRALGIKHTNAWDMVEKMNNLGNSQTIYNIYDDPSFRNVNSAQELKAVTRQVKKNSQTKAEDYKIGDIVGMFYSDSLHHRETLNSKTHNTHVGWVVDIDENGKPIIAHNMFGKIKKDPYDKVVTTWIQRPNKEVLMLSNAWQGKNNVVYNDSDYKSTTNNDGILKDFEQKIERPLTEEEKKLVNNNVNRIRYSSEKIKNDIKSTAPVDWLQATAFGITGAESSAGINANRSVTDIEEKETLRPIAYAIKGIEDKDISLGVSKVKYSTLSPLAKQYFNITSPEDLGNDNKNIDITIYNLATAYETFKDYASQYPELGLTEIDIRNMAVLAHNQGVPSLLRTGRSKKEEKQGGYDYELEIAELRNLYEGEIEDVSSTNWGRVFGDNPITRLFVDPSEGYISKVNRYANEVFAPNIKKYGGWLDKYQGDKGSSQVNTTQNFIPVSREWYKDPQTGIMRNQYFDAQGYNPETGGYQYPMAYDPNTDESLIRVDLPAAEVTTELPAKYLARDMRNAAQGILEFSGELSGVLPVGRTVDRLKNDPRQLGLDIKDTFADAAYMFFNSPNERAKYNGLNPWTDRQLGSGLDATLDAVETGLTFAPGLGYLGKAGLRGTKQLNNFVRGRRVFNTPIQLPGSGNVAPVVNTTPAPWSMQKMPGLHIKSTMSGSPLEKQLSKTGEINRNNIIAHINKAETSAADKFTLQRVLDEKFPNQNKIDYNQFRRAVSDEAIELERKVVENYVHNNWGVGRLGYPDAKRSSYDAAIKSGQDNIEYLEKKLSGTIESTSRFTSDQIRKNIELQLSETKAQLAEYLSEYEKLPLENVSVTYGNPTKFGRGSSDHFDESTLGHARTLVSSEEPDIMHFLEQQSDYWQKLGKTKPINIEKYKEVLARKEASYLNDLETLKKLKQTKMDYAGNPKSDWEISQFEDIVNKKGAELNMRKGDIFNPQQKEFLGKAHQERLFQENVRYAAEQGKSSVRFPTSETAIKIQGYTPKILKNELNGHLENLTYLKNDPDFIKIPGDEILSMNDYGYKSLSETPVTKNEYLKLLNERIDKLKSLSDKELNAATYSPRHQTIIKKYAEQPKTIKKLFGVEPRTVTDSKGNTWYEFDIPESYKQGKAEIRAFSMGGAAIIGAGAMQEKKYEGDIKSYQIGGKKKNSLPPLWEAVPGLYPTEQVAPAVSTAVQTPIIQQAKLAEQKAKKVAKETGISEEQAFKQELSRPGSLQNFDQRMNTVEQERDRIAAITGTKPSYKEVDNNLRLNIRPDFVFDPDKPETAARLKAYREKYGIPENDVSFWDRFGDPLKQTEFFLREGRLPTALEMQNPESYYGVSDLIEPAAEGTAYALTGLGAARLIGMGKNALPIINRALNTPIASSTAWGMPTITAGNALQAYGLGLSIDHMPELKESISNIGNPDNEKAYSQEVFNALGDAGLVGLGFTGLGIGKQAIKRASQLDNFIKDRRAIDSPFSSNAPALLGSADDVSRLESEIATLKNQEIANENIRKNLWADYKAGKITGEEYSFKANELFESQGGFNNPRYNLEKQLRELKIKNDIANTPQQNILQSESQLGKNISTGGGNTKGVFELGDDYVARLSAHGYDDASRLVNYKDKITSPRVAKTLQVKEIDGKVYQVQQKATGKPLNQLSQEELSNIPKEHINNFWKDKAEIDNLGLNIDVSGGKSNIFYDPKKGFQLIDLGIGPSTRVDDIIITNPILGSGNATKGLSSLSINPYAPSFNNASYPSQSSIKYMQSKGLKPIDPSSKKFKELENKYGIKSIKLSPEDFTEADQFAAFDEGTDFATRWAYDKVKLDKLNDSYMQDYRNLKVDLASKLKPLLEKLNDLEFEIQTTADKEKKLLLQSEKNQVEAKIDNLYDVSNQELQTLTENARNTPGIFDPTFEEKIYNIFDLAQTSGRQTSRLNPLNIKKNPDYLVDVDPNDPVFQSLPDDDRDYLAKNWPNIGGVRTGSSTITLRGRPGAVNYAVEKTPIGINPKTWFNRNKLIELKNTNWVDPISIGEVAAHEVGHDIQNFSDWINLLQHYDDQYKYYTGHSYNPIAKRFKDAMVEPVLPNPATPDDFGYETWKSGVGELHSELMKARLRAAKKLMKSYNISMDRAISEIKKQTDDLSDPTMVDWLIDNGDLNKHFKSSTSREEKRELIRFLPGLITTGGIGGLGYLYTQGLQGNQNLQKYGGWLNNYK